MMEKVGALQSRNGELGRGAAVFLWSYRAGWRAAQGFGFLWVKLASEVLVTDSLPSLHVLPKVLVKAVQV